MAMLKVKEVAERLRVSHDVVIRRDCLLRPMAGGLYEGVRARTTTCICFRHLWANITTKQRCAPGRWQTSLGLGLTRSLGSIKLRVCCLSQQPT